MNLVLQPVMPTINGVILRVPVLIHSCRDGQMETDWRGSNGQGRVLAGAALVLGERSTEDLHPRKFAGCRVLVTKLGCGTGESTVQYRIVPQLFRTTV